MRSIGASGSRLLQSHENRFLNAEDAEGFAKVAEENLCVPLRKTLRPLRLLIICLCTTQFKFAPRNLLT